MLVHDFEQGSVEWHQARLGIPTASCFDKIITPAKGEFSKSARPYMYQLIAELMLNRVFMSLDGLEHVERGKELEPTAARMYEMLNEVKLETVGFITTDDGRYGCSPDRLVGEDGLVEIKCPAPQTHVGYLVDGIGNDYKCQLQGQLLVTGRSWVDIFSYSPDMPPFSDRVVRDQDFIDKMVAALEQFCDMKTKAIADLETRGLFFRASSIILPQEEAYAETLAGGEA